MSSYCVRATLLWQVQAESRAAAEQWAAYEGAHLAERAGLLGGDPYGAVTVVGRPTVDVEVREVEVGPDPLPRERSDDGRA